MKPATSNCSRLQWAIVLRLPPRRQDHEQQGSCARCRQNPQCDPLSKYHGRAGSAGHSSAAQSSARRHWWNLLSAFEGLLYGCGDAVIGVNPATDSVETVSSILHALQRLVDVYNIPTQTCCLAHITTQLAAMDRGAPVDLLFQSVAGTEAANQSFGITLSMLREGQREGARTSSPARRRVERHERHVLRNRPGQRPLRRGPSWNRPTDPGGSRLWRCPGICSHSW